MASLLLAPPYPRTRKRPSLRPVLMLPQSAQRWLVGQPAGALSQRVANVESYALDRLFPGVDMHNETMITMVKRHMAGRLGLVQDVMAAQLRTLVDARLDPHGSGRGRDDDEKNPTTPAEWQTVNLALFVRDVVTRTGYRIHVGAQLSADPAFIAASWGMTLWAGVGTIIVGQFAPPLLKCGLGLLCSLPISWYIRRYRRVIYPVFKERMEAVERVLSLKNGGTKGEVAAALECEYEDGNESSELPQDAMTWTALTLHERNPDGDTLEGIIDNFITIFTAAFATIPVTIHALLNLISLPEAQAYLPLLREDITRTFADAAAWSAPHTTAPGRMPLLEAFLRESMRYTPFFARGQEHKVVAREGVYLADGTTHVPYGTILACPVAGIVDDERFYAKPEVFDPFRFLDKVVDGEGGVGERYTLKANCQLTSPSDVFLGFGYGRHACPGRFFAARIMKLMIAYLIFQYEFEPLNKRPRNFVVGSFTIPPLFTKVKFRRRTR
ncbi:cytochrome P450 [Whalleya microplaca]|nr:cytochrome P450 [Whalleya microplaca]